jgi:hypothetical protein
MSIRNATIARRKRKIGLSEQERIALNPLLRRNAGKHGKSKPQQGALPMKKAISWHANWAEC